ncbi:hypothetical protein [Paraburkholderia caribensis]|uniref:hypothetical protein n=1 Tax=Paraburkholderia caribensis TaxID=75105 RepID=UPI001CAB4E22|nr:hypothetical protein [Paraburkholderia caribensis]CAG9262251.1 hypothetical protein PCAR4_560038 [Paraburkholderia caribensis]
MIRFCGRLIALFVGASAGFGMEHVMAARVLEHEKLEHARDNEMHALKLKALSDEALAANQKALASTALAERQLEAMDVQLGKERKARENADRHYHDALARGIERLHIPVRDVRVDGPIRHFVGEAYHER